MLFRSSTVVPPTNPLQPPLSFFAKPRFEAIEARLDPPPSNAPKPPEIPCDNVRAYGLIRSRIKFVPMSLRAVFRLFVLPIKKLKKPSSTVFDILETVSAQEFLMSLKAAFEFLTYGSRYFFFWISRYYYEIGRASCRERV